MAKAVQFAAVDLGAESGRVIMASLSDAGITIEEIHRFPNGPVRVAGSLHWDILRLFSEIKHGLSMCAAQAGSLAGIGLDTWGVDFGLLDQTGTLIGNPYHYRDARTDGMLEKAFRIVPQLEIFERTGIQFMQINSLYQLLSMAGSPALEIAHTFLTIPDLLNYWLCGEKACEFTNATTTQMYDQRAGGWAKGLLHRLGLPAEILPEVVLPGANLGKLLPDVAKEIGVNPLPVIAPACHDTGSAVAAVPALSGNFAYISSGTWSLVGTEAAQPVISARSFEYNFTNEGGVAGTVRLLKNVTGLWLVQECRRAWANTGESFSYAELAQLASEAAPFGALIDPDAPAFLHPENMPDAIARQCTQTGQKPPQSRGALLRCIFESLALKYRWVLERLVELTGEPVETIHIIGGGSQNTFLNQLTANATGIPVVAGPVEATALGNAMLQAISLGYFASVQEARQVIGRGLDLRPYAPQPDPRWDEAYARFVSILRP